MDKDLLVGSAKEIEGAVRLGPHACRRECPILLRRHARPLSNLRKLSVFNVSPLPPATGGKQPWRIIMKKTMLIASAAMIGVGLLAAPAKAQGVPQSIEIAKVDVQKVAAGYRASKVIGSSVLNEANETIGKIDDLLVTRDGKEPYAVLSIGGFLGMGTHMVVVRYDSLKFADNKIVLPGGSKDGLKMLPVFQYSKE
jgi:PRC-barrel domain